MLTQKTHAMPKTNNYTIYLIKNKSAKLEEIIRTEYEDAEINLEIGGTATALYIGRHPLRPPKWSSRFAGFVNLEAFGKTMAPGAVLLLEVDGATFAVTFGTGRFIMEPECYEERFGLITVLNSINENAIKSIDKKTVDSISRQTREQASRDVRARDFGLDVERDLLRAVTGTPTEKELGQRLYGMDALRITVKADLQDLPELIQKYYKKYQGTAYKATFPWVDLLAEVKQKTVKADLDAQMIKLITEGRYERFWLAAPDIIEWDVVAGFRYGSSMKSEPLPDLDFHDFRAHLPGGEGLDRAALDRRVCCYDGNDTRIHEWSVYQCINCEIDDTKGNAYLLSGGKWYRIAKNFVEEVNAFVKGVGRYDFEFPDYCHKNEAKYNEYLAREYKDRFLLQDCKNIPHGGGRSKIEFCDIYDQKGGIIHIKRYGGSSVLSHLFAQGLISGELFKSDGAFRQKVFKQLALPEPLKPEDHTIVFAVISKAKGDALELPFFSRLNLKHAVRRLTNFGYKVRIAKIGVGSSGATPSVSKAEVLETV